MQIIDVQLVKQKQPYFIFFESGITDLQQIFSFTIPYGFGYLLRRLTADWNTINVAPAALEPISLNLELFDTIGDLSRQKDPIPLNLISSPAGVPDTILSAAAGPGSPFYSGPGGALRGIYSAHKTLNYYYAYGSTIQIRITGQDANTTPAIPGGNTNMVVQLVLEGSLILESENSNHV